MARKPQRLPYPVTEEWCTRVREALDAKAKRESLPIRGAQARLQAYLASRGIKVSTGSLAEILDGKTYRTSDLVEPIHEYLDWSPPLPPTASLDAGELLHLHDRMTKAQREFFEEAGRALQGLSGDEAKHALIAMLQVFRAQRPQND